MIVSLVGLPGSGKTTVGRQLARRLQLPFQDSDQVIEVRIGIPIRTYFEQHGEAPFRDLEEQVIAELVAGPSCVLSTGGGVVLRTNNRHALHRSGPVVYLKSNPDELYRRLRHDQSRPLLQVADPLGKMRDLFAVRDPLYRETAHFVMETGRPSVATLVNMIVMQLELAGTPAK
ncbi:shikimate kinase [Rhodoferax aquaticus]|uniref:Shikimate kinase n=1 Tax=Rhodoferax aquaticus TaxID=2527691 RepID=A0A515ET15_9BURK|nr:shikimate kinase [Rhodoferax aquaticus]QDL55791.1 shikimate kinase [Rhodoferax aquaticus]